MRPSGSTRASRAAKVPPSRKRGSSSPRLRDDPRPREPGGLAVTRSQEGGATAVHVGRESDRNDRTRRSDDCTFGITVDGDTWRITQPGSPPLTGTVGSPPAVSGFFTELDLRADPGLRVDVRPLRPGHPTHDDADRSAPPDRGAASRCDRGPRAVDPQVETGTPCRPPEARRAGRRRDARHRRVVAARAAPLRRRLGARTRAQLARLGRVLQLLRVRGSKPPARDVVRMAAALPRRAHELARPPPPPDGVLPHRCLAGVSLVPRAAHRACARPERHLVVGRDARVLRRCRRLWHDPARRAGDRPLRRRRACVLSPLHRQSRAWAFSSSRCSCPVSR